MEVLGKPKEHVEEALKEYIQKLKADKHYKVLIEEYAETQKKDNQELWSTFVELEISTESIQDIIGFCFDYMPALIEIIEPEELTLTDMDISNFLSDLQGKLHQVDMVAKQTKMENDHLMLNMSVLFKNYILVMLVRGGMTSEQMSKLTGVNQDKVEDFLDKLIDDKKIDLKEGIYFLLDK